MHGGKNRPFIAKLDVTVLQNIGRSCSKNSSSGMAFAPDEIKPTKSMRLIGQIAHSMTSFRPWSCKILMGDEYREFL